MLPSTWSTSTRSSGSKKGRPPALGSLGVRLACASTHRQTPRSALGTGWNLWAAAVPTSCSVVPAVCSAVSASCPSDSTPSFPAELAESSSWHTCEVCGTSESRHHYLFQVRRAWSLRQCLPKEEPSTYPSAEPAVDKEREPNPAD
jgi:hypothetical protein